MVVLAVLHPTLDLPRHNGILKQPHNKCGRHQQACGVKRNGNNVMAESLRMLEAATDFFVSAVAVYQHVPA